MELTVHRAQWPVSGYYLGLHLLRPTADGASNLVCLDGTRTMALLCISREARIGVVMWQTTGFSKTDKYPCAGKKYMYMCMDMDMNTYR